MMFKCEGNGKTIYFNTKNIDTIEIMNEKTAVVTLNNNSAAILVKKEDAESLKDYINAERQEERRLEEAKLRYYEVRVSLL